MKPAMDFVCQELEPTTRPDVIRSRFREYMKPRWDVFSDPRYQGKKSTYAVWFLHMLSYFIFVKFPQFPVRPEDGNKYELYQKMEAIRLRSLAVSFSLFHRLYLWPGIVVDIFMTKGKQI